MGYYKDISSLVRKKLQEDNRPTIEIEMVLLYNCRCEDYEHSRVLHQRAKYSQLDEFNTMLRDCESKHEEMRLLNNRHR